MYEDQEVPPPAAATPEEWERFLRAERTTDANPIVLTERQASRIQWICSAVCDPDSPDHEAAVGQLAHASAFLADLIIESKHGQGRQPTASERWEALDDLPYYLRNGSHVQRLEHLRSLGLDPYGNPLDD